MDGLGFAMNRLLVLSACVALSYSSTSFGAPPQRTPFEFKDGDRVALLGGTYVERAQRYGWLESEFQLASPGKKISFRNLGWSGDTVWSESRGIFDKPAVGYGRMIKQIKELKPTVILIHYGTNEAFKGPSGIDAFLGQYKRLISDVSSTNAQVVIASPIPQFKMPAPLPDPTRVNGLTKQYVEALRALAAEQKLTFVDLWTGHAKTAANASREGRTDNGIHLTSKGYRWSASIFAKALLNADQEINANKAKALVDQTVEKNRMYFYRWRPQNVTYLFGFRKHEQGNNAKEVAEFDPIVNKMEQTIFELKKAYAK
jgi:lysophospholipase L1-like esterase